MKLRHSTIEKHRHIKLVIGEYVSVLTLFVYIFALFHMIEFVLCVAMLILFFLYIVIIDFRHSKWVEAGFVLVIPSSYLLFGLICNWLRPSDVM